MKATGIVRRIDDLGRVVIPREIRRTLRIREGDPLEIYTAKDGEVIFKKYSPMGDLTEFAGRVCEALRQNTGFACAVADRDGIIALSGAPKQELLDRRSSPELLALLEDRRIYRFDGTGRRIPVTEGSVWSVGVAAPVSCEGDLLGGVLLLLGPEERKLPNQFEERIYATVAAFLGRQMES